jgi:16S rRNA (adenine1518-N6/adenine1519-N6)-dimethyltransferase
VSRRLGQHFLRDPAILDRIVDALDPAPDDLVLEIGPGEGSLTERLLMRVGAVLAIEKDRRLAEQLGAESRGAEGRGETGYGTWGDLVVRCADALEIDWMALARDAFPASRLSLPPKLIGNIPYYITSPLIEKALAPPCPRVIVFLVQREVADRVSAEPGSKAFGALTVGVQTAARAERLFSVKAGAFRPPPKVESAVVRLTPLEQPLVAPARRAAFRAFTTQLFAQRRKQLVRSLRAVAGIDRDAALALLERLGIPPAARPETVAPRDLVALFNSLTEFPRADRL